MDQWLYRGCCRVARAPRRRMTTCRDARASRRERPITGRCSLSDRRCEARSWVRCRIRCDVLTSAARSASLGESGLQCGGGRVVPRVVWFDIPVADMTRAIEFYEALTGDQLVRLPVGEQMEPAICRRSLIFRGCARPRATLKNIEMRTDAVKLLSRGSGFASAAATPGAGSVRA